MNVTDPDTGQVEDPGHDPQTLEGRDSSQRSLSEKALRPQDSPKWLQILTCGPQSAPALSVPAEASSP